MTIITINVQNNSPSTQSFMYFMEPVTVATTTAYSNSLGTGTVGNYAQTGTILTFQLDFGYFAGVQQASSVPQYGMQSGYYSACQPISLSDGQPDEKCATTMSLDPLSLSPAVYTQNVKNGSFRITTPGYDSATRIYNAGTGLRTSSGGVVLPSFIVASPLTNIDVTPSRTFFVAIGSAATGVVIAPANVTNNAACNATAYNSFLVKYDATGAFTVSSYIDPTNAMAVSGTSPNQILVAL